MAEPNNRRRGAERLDPKLKTRSTAKRSVGAATGRGEKTRQTRTSALRFESNSHWQTAKTAFSRLLTTPGATLMTLAVLAIALALPGVLYTGLKNVQQLAQSWEGDPRIALYLDQALSDEQADGFSRQLLLREDLQAVELTSREKGLEEFRALSGFGDVLEYLDHNPIPAVITVLPKRMSPDELIELQQQLESEPQVEEADLDMAWVQRLSGALEVAQRAVVILGLLLATAVLLVVGNTVRVSIESRRDEILVAKLVGATDEWVRRPFLYTGAWYGVLGGLAGWGLIQFSLMLIDTPVRQLAGLYQNSFSMLGLGIVDTLLLIGLSLVLGLAGAWVAVGRYLRAIEPE